MLGIPIGMARFRALLRRRAGVNGQVRQSDVSRPQPTDHPYARPTGSIRPRNTEWKSAATGSRRIAEPSLRQPARSSGHQGSRDRRGQSLGLRATAPIAAAESARVRLPAKSGSSGHPSKDSVSHGSLWGRCRRCLRARNRPDTRGRRTDTTTPTECA